MHTLIAIALLWEAYTLLRWGPLTYLRRWCNVLIGIDQTVNAWLGGDPDETISSRAAKRSHVWGWHLLGSLLEAVDPGHLGRAKEDDEGGNATF